jgi:ATP-dependent helicase/nuclease subunit B
LAGLIALIDRFDDPAVPYRSVPRPAFAPRFSDYRHLARVAEWSVAAGDEE